MKKHIQNIWAGLNVLERICWTGIMFGSVSVVILVLFGMFGELSDTLNVAIPILGVIQLAQAGFNWRRTRTVAILSLVCAAIIIACTVAIWIL